MLRAIAEHAAEIDADAGSADHRRDAARLRCGGLQLPRRPGRPPAPVIARLNREVNAILADAAFRRRLGELGLEPIGGTPEQTAATIRAEAARWRAVIVAGKIKVE